jgi:hypothetical protein
MSYPLKKPGQAPGCDLITRAPEIASWLATIASGAPTSAAEFLASNGQTQRLVVGSYAYLDGANFVRIAVAMDAIAAKLLADRPNTAVAYLCTPTDAHLRPAVAALAAARNWRGKPGWQTLLAIWPGLPKNFSRTSDVVNCIVPQQGPNYILAKRIQHWRCILTAADGGLCSSNVAPATNTASVLSNKAAVALYNGLPAFKPMEVFEEATSRQVMGLLLLHDLHCPRRPGGG